MLSPDRAALHLPCVDLLQLMLSLMPSHLVENQLAADMTHPDLTIRYHQTYHPATHTPGPHHQVT